MTCRSNHKSASDHASDVISRCAQSIHAVRTLRCYAMSDDRSTNLLSSRSCCTCLVYHGGGCECCRTSAVRSFCSSRYTEWCLQRR